jgi:hypothetical protein
MAVWGIVAIIFLFIIFTVFVVLNVMTTSNNIKIAQTQQFIPFSSTIDPTTGAPPVPPNGSSETPFTTTDQNGKLIPQIRCPVGTKINITGAFFDVFDPYNTCTSDKNQVNPYFGFLCIPGFSGKNPNTGASIALCNTIADCSKYGAEGQFECGPDNTCVLADYSKKDCPMWNSPYSGRIQLKPITDSTGKKYCVDPNMCGSNIAAAYSNGTTGVPNPFCSPGTTLGNVSKCAVRDASATVAAKCNGRQTCGDLTMEDFGDYPCQGIKPSQCIIGTNKDGSPKWFGDKTGTIRPTGYCSLPFLQGYKGGLPENATGDPDPRNYNHGYVMHGLYSCVAE